MGIRTPDLLNAIEALYQLSYDPVLRKVLFITEITSTKQMQVRISTRTIPWET